MYIEVYVGDFNSNELRNHFHNNEKCAGEILEFCQSGKEGTLPFIERFIIILFFRHLPSSISGSLLVTKEITKFKVSKNWICMLIL